MTGNTLLRTGVRFGAVHNTGRMETRMDSKMMSTKDELAAMVARLKASKSRTEVEDRLRGIDSGMAFAARRASYRMLQAIDAMAADYSSSDAFDPEGGAMLFIRELARCLREWYGEDHDEKELMDTLFPLEACRRSPDFLASFVESAAEMWKEVEEQLG